MRGEAWEGLREECPMQKNQQVQGFAWGQSLPWSRQEAKLDRGQRKRVMGRNKKMKRGKCM